MKDFVLLDLQSQFDLVKILIKDYSNEQILNWLSQFGKVSKIEHPLDNHLYRFVSHGGLETVFRFDTQYKIVIIGDHYTRV